jgi:hypothetical protein
LTNRFWAERHLGLPKLKRRPSEYLKEHAYWGFFEDHVGVKLRHEIGVDRMMWSTDFPHVRDALAQIGRDVSLANRVCARGRALANGGRQRHQVFSP